MQGRMTHHFLGVRPGEKQALDSRVEELENRK